jgi:hypothetical protein
MTTIVTLLAPYNGGLTGQIMGLPDATATALVTAGGATLANLGAGAGVPVHPAGGYQGQIASEATSVFLARIPGGVPNPGDPVRAVENSPAVIVAGILQP